MFNHCNYKKEIHCITHLLRLDRLEQFWYMITTLNQADIMTLKLVYQTDFFSLSLACQDGHMISYLPLSHVAAQMTDIMAMLVTGHTMWFAQPDAMKGSLRDTLLVINSHIQYKCTCVHAHVFECTCIQGWRKIQEYLYLAVF